MTRTKLELTRIGKDKEYNLEPRILIERPDLSHDPDGTSDNLLIHGDNLLALKALEQTYAGQVKCIYIDPPYNTGNAFEHYDDGLEHSEWLNLMKPRLELLRNLLSDDGSIRISIDADESHYLKVLCDEIFGRKNFVDEVIRQRAFSPINLKKTLSRSHDIILVYAKNFDQKFSLNSLSRSDKQIDTYKNPDNDERWVRTSSDCTVWPVVKEKLYEITTPGWKVVTPPDGRCRLFTKDRFEEMKKDSRIYFGKDWNNAPRVKKFITEVKWWVTAMTLWLRDEVWDNQEAKREIKFIANNDIFTTPKPERLIERVLHLWSNPWDLVLDSFLWSWTTAAVAHKMGRRWIGIELWDHAYTHAKVRMDKVIEGEQGGISKVVEWTWWWSYKFLELGPSLLIQDQYGQRIINQALDGDKLIQALCKIENYQYTYDDHGIKHGRSSETSFLHVTTRHINQAIVDDIASSHLWSNEWLLILARTYDTGIVLPSNIRLKKIPKSILNKCEYGRSDYNLPVTEQDYQEEEYDDQE